MWPPAFLKQKIEHLRFRSYVGTSIKPHRAIYHVQMHKGNFFFALLLPLVFNLTLAVFLDQIVAWWHAVFEFWLQRLDPGSEVSSHPIDLGNYILSLPYPNLSSASPDSELWWITLLCCLVIFIATFFIPRQHFLPLTYFVRACLLIQATALAYFAIVPAEFPYDLPSYIANSLFMAMIFLYLIPWVLGFTYYVFNFPLIQKIVLTAVTLIYFMVVIPMQYLFHAYILHHFSLLFLPLLYLVFGVFIDIMMFVAFYSWGMSWDWRLPWKSSRD